MLSITPERWLVLLAMYLLMLCIGCSGSPSPSGKTPTPNVKEAAQKSDSGGVNISDIVVSVDGLPIDAKSTIDCAPGGSILIAGSIYASSGRRFYDDDFVIHQKGGVAALDPDHILPRRPREILDESRGTYLVLVTKLTAADQKPGDQATGLGPFSNFVFRKLRENGGQADYALKRQVLPKRPGVYLLTLEIFTPTSIKEREDGGIDFGQSRSVDICHIKISNDATAPVPVKNVR